MTAINSRLSDEDAYQVKAEMCIHKEEQLSGVDVYVGVHPIHGPIHLVIPLMGESILLFPIELHL